MSERGTEIPQAPRALSFAERQELVRALIEGGWRTTEDRLPADNVSRRP